MIPEKKPVELIRGLDLMGAVAIGMGAIIGAGIFVVTGVAAGIAGSAFLAGLVIAGIAATCNGLSSAQLAATYPQSGGTYEYGYRVLHPLFGFSAGWMFLASKLAAGSVVALGFGNYFAEIFPPVSPRTAGLSAVVLLTIANLFGIKKTGYLNLVIVSITLLTLIYFIIAGIPVFDPVNLKPFAPNGLKGIAKASALLFFAFTGYARLATLGEEVGDPKRTIPKAIIITLIFSIILYLAIGMVTVGSIGAVAMAGSHSPLQEAARYFTLPGVLLGITIGACTAMLGVLLSQLLGISRMMFALARRNDLPSFLQQVNSFSHVPQWGILFSGAIIFLLTLFGTLEWILSGAAFTILLYYTITNIAAIKMPSEDKLYSDWIPATGFVFCIALALSLDIKTIITGLALLAAGLFFRWIFHKVGLVKI